MTESWHFGFESASSTHVSSTTLQEFSFWHSERLTAKSPHRFVSSPAKRISGYCSYLGGFLARQ